ncbi:uncharacterized protein LOC124439080 [Xenia sp. Carnegie-2017]|uniref:uncharacterized protein LOC124439080 n=1 Tax=Xenia sp. Carnegie-2017 TaxID=2897299 RepID=UPI001F0339B9|nr:uncharacterized protein LOC124439080 [Xenia sp. Carnegie-2017]
MALTKAKKLQAVAVITSLMVHELKKKRKSRRWWVKPWKTAQRRYAQGLAQNLIQEIRVTDHDVFRNLFRMDSILFDELREKLTPFIQKKNITMRDAISAHDCLCVTLKFLASGCSYKDLMYSFRISVSSISKNCT